MANKPKILPKFIPELLIRNAQGQSYDSIRQWLEADHGVMVTRQSVSEALIRARKDRGTLVRDHARDLLTGEVLADIQILQLIKQTELQALQEADTSKERRAAESQLIKAIELSLRFSGLGQAEDRSDHSAEVMTRLRALVESSEGERVLLAEPVLPTE